MNRDDDTPSIQKRNHKKTAKKEDSNETCIELIQYTPTELAIRPLKIGTKLKDEVDDEKINWIKINGLTDAAGISKICGEFGLASFDIKELISAQQLVKVVEYEKFTFILMAAFYANGNKELEKTQIAFIVGNNYLVSFKKDSVHIFDNVIKAIEENNTPLRQKGTDYLLYILLTTVNSLNTNLIKIAEDELTDIEDQLMLRQEIPDVLRLLHKRRIDYLHIKRFVVSFKEEFSNLQYNTNKIIREENKIYFNDIEDRLRTTLGSLEDLHESLVSLLSVYYNNNNLKMNEVITRLTVISTIFIPLTFLVGVWGMNFKIMPELEWKYGYLVAWASFIIIAAVGLWWLKKKKWF